MLLTSSQVSVIISSGIVVLCTAALFLSGYTIQQRTLRDLRAAIKPNRTPPQPSPKSHLPDYFKKPAAQLDDGRVLEIDDLRLADRYNEHGSEEEDLVIVRPTVPEEEELQQQKPVVPAKKSSSGVRGNVQNDKTQKPISRVERRRQIKEEIRRLSEGNERVYYQRRLW